MDQIETLIYAGNIASIGTFRCPPEHVRFSGGSTDAHLAVFPRTAVIIEREHVGPVVADPNTVVFYQPGDEYERRGIDRRGDHCDFFSVAPDVAEEIVGNGPSFSGSGHGPAPADLYLAQRSLVTALSAEDHADSLAVEEAVLTVFDRAASHAAHQKGETPARSKTHSRHAAIVRRTRRELVERANSRVSLSDVATAVAVSPFHLARLFHRHTGFTVHSFVTQLRLRRSLDFLIRPDIDLATLALELGFSSHSHFTNVFRRVFGMTPSAYRRSGPTPNADLRKILTV